MATVGKIVGFVIGQLIGHAVFLAIVSSKKIQNRCGHGRWLKKESLMLRISHKNQTATLV